MVPVPGVEVEEGMKFVEYKTHLELNSTKSFQKNVLSSSQSLVKYHFDLILGSNDPKFKFTNVSLLCDLSWYAYKRPYYILYPAAEEAFSRIKLESKFIEFVVSECVNKWPAKDEILKKNVVMPCLAVHTERYGYLVSFDRTIEENIPGFTITRVTENTKRLDDKVMSFVFPQNFEDVEINSALIICMFLYMTGDAEFAERLLLSKDEKRHPRGEDYERAVERAIRRGKNGWSIGKDWDSIPHFRRPHFGIRWTGKGGKIPKLVPIKGSFVKRSEMLKVPTGYLDKGHRKNVTN